MTVQDGLNRVAELEGLVEDMDKLCDYIATNWSQDEMDALSKNTGLHLPIKFLLPRIRNTIKIRGDEIKESIMNTQLDFSSIKLS